MFSFDQYQESADYIAARLGSFRPEYLLILGSGLGFLAEEAQSSIVINYADIPHFNTPTAPGHKGRLVCGKLGAKPVMLMQGRFHLYEGYTAEEVVFPIRVAKLLGVTSLIVTNAAGGINLEYNPGELVALNDFIRLSFPNPQIGPNIPEFGQRFFDMSYVFDPAYLTLIKELAGKQGIKLHEGVYFYASGPQFETPAEIRALRILGGDLVGMSTVHECIAARQADMRILGISLVTNMAAGVLAQKLSEEEVWRVAEAVKEPFTMLIRSFLEQV